MSYTKGEWGREGRHIYAKRYDEKLKKEVDVRIAHCGTPQSRIHKEQVGRTDREWKPLHQEAEANARLIAAAPKLLETLEEIKQHTTLDYETTYKHACFAIHRIAEAAIAAAEK